MSRPPLGDPSRVPTEPISRLIRVYIAEHRDSERTTRSIIADLVDTVRHTDYHHFCTRIVYAGSKTIDRDLADRILCAIDCVEAWYTEPELAAA